MGNYWVEAAVRHLPRPLSSSSEAAEVAGLGQRRVGHQQKVVVKVVAQVPMRVHDSDCDLDCYEVVVAAKAVLASY